MVSGNHRLKTLRTPTRSKPRPTTTNQFWGIDMRKVMGEPVGWGCLLLDSPTYKIVGHYAALLDENVPLAHRDGDGGASTSPLGGAMTTRSPSNDAGTGTVLAPCWATANYAFSLGPSEFGFFKP